MEKKKTKYNDDNSGVEEYQNDDERDDIDYEGLDKKIDKSNINLKDKIKLIVILEHA